MFRECVTAYKVVVEGLGVGLVGGVVGEGEG
jgi:hypothetical protein